jgi:hypothetical protein
MAFQALGLTEDQTRVMEAAVRGLVDDARRNDQQVIAGLTTQMQLLSTASQQQRGAAAPRTPDFLDTRLGKPHTFAGTEAKWEAWWFKFKAYMTSLGGPYPAMLAACENTHTEIHLASLDEDDAEAAR